MKVSIVTTVCNGEKFLSETIESILSQRGDFDLEYILVDGKSTDSSLSIAHKYKKLVDGGYYSDRRLSTSMTVISEKDKGMYDGIAKGLKLCSGDVIAYLNSDDFYVPNSLSAVVDVLDKFPQVKWVSGCFSSSNEAGYILYSSPSEIDTTLIREGIYGHYSEFYIPQESTFWRRELLESVELDKFSNYRYAGDFFLWYNFAEKHTLYSINSQLGVFRRRENQISSDILFYKMEVKKILDNNVGLSAMDKAKFICNECLKQQSSIRWSEKAKKWKISRRANYFVKYSHYLFGLFLVYVFHLGLNEIKKINYMFSIDEMDSKSKGYFINKEVCYESDRVIKKIRVLGVPVIKAVYYKNKAKYFVCGILLWKIRYVCQRD
ncbi:MAG: glycosyltransferase [Holosporaceae bacterium]|jgi:glycosyltransferase involved in cell wall biosynthesis|nr:glycosyltransferase [Holosporaceae bacterium]